MKKILITGASDGIGKALALMLDEKGYKTYLFSRNPEKLNSLKLNNCLKKYAFDLKDRDKLNEALNDIRLSGGVDILINNAGFNYKKEEVKEMMEFARNKMGSIDILINNAGISLHENTFFDVTPDTFDKQTDTNFKGAFFLTQEFIRKVKAEGRKANVLFVSSETGDTMDFRPYGFTKAAVNSMVQGLAYLFRKENIRINAVAPGITASDMTGINADGDISAGDYATGRYYLPEEVAETACFLLSDASGCVSGQIITCNNAQTVNVRWK